MITDLSSLFETLSVGPPDLIVGSKRNVPAIVLWRCLGVLRTHGGCYGGVGAAVKMCRVQRWCKGSCGGYCRGVCTCGGGAVEFWWLLRR